MISPSKAKGFESEFGVLSVGQKKKKAWEGKLSESEASSDGTFSRTSHA